jgi:signal transduction histidine kinase
MATPIFGRLRLATFAFLGTVIVALLISAALTVHELQQLRAARDYLARVDAFERVHLLVERRLTLIAKDTGDNPADRQEVAQQIDQLIALAVDPDTPARLQELRVRVGRSGLAGIEKVEPLVLFNQADDQEQARRLDFLAQLERQNALQLRLELAAPLAIFLGTLILLPIARRRIIQPLDAFGHQLTRLADGDFSPKPIDERIDPFLLPLHRRFNELAGRLQELEAAHRVHEESLEGKVRAATSQLLEQQRTLARAERLAATGELAASVAHELRNPLAGIQMTLSNLRNEVHDPELIERVDLTIHEVARLSRLLSDLLDAGRHAPEPARPVALGALVDEIVSLNRYQLAADIRLESHVDPALTCRLPQDRLRQALLNLVLNAAGALAGRGGTIRVDASAAGRSVRITVSDDGPGFPLELLESGIRPFFSTRERGTGLGLAMVRRFARDVGGSVELANLDPHGARVTLVLPCDAEA